MKNLLIIVPNLQLGGQERVACNTANILASEYNITMLIFDGSVSVYKPNCEIINIDIPTQPGILNKVKNVIKRIIAVKKLKKQRHIDYSYSLGETANLVNVFSTYQDESIISIRGFTSTQNTIINKVVFYFADKIVCCSKVISQKVMDDFHVKKSKVKTLYNPYDVNYIQVLGKENVADFTFDKKTIVSQGRYEGIKNYTRLIKAFSIVKSRQEDIQLLLIGEGVYRSKLELLIQKYHLEKDVTLLGFRENSFAYIAKSDLYVLSSHSEGFPNAMVEGMIFLPTIAVDCKSGPREILSNDDIQKVADGVELATYGILVSPEPEGLSEVDITEADETLAEAIEKLLLDNILCESYKEKAKLRSMEFSNEVYKKRMKQILESAV